MQRLRILSLVAGVLALSAMLPSTRAADGDWTTIKGQVILSSAGDAKKIDPTTDKDHCLSKGPLVSSDILVNAKSKGVKNVVVWLRPDSKDRKATFPAEKIHPDLVKASAKSHVIDQPCCQFEPRIIAARTGDTLEVKNSAPVAHNINYNSDAEQFNVTLQSGKSHKLSQPLATQNTPILFKCDIHPWMQGRVRVFDHPYFAITDENGNFEIKNVPAGTWRIVYWHENGFHKGRDGILGFPVEAKGATTELKPVELELPK